MDPNTHPQSGSRTIVCVECSLTFECPPSRGRPPSVCSVECKTKRRARQFRSSDDRKLRQVAKVREAQPQALKPCQRCGAEFKRGRGTRYCSPQCAREAKLEAASRRARTWRDKVLASGESCAVEGCEKPPTHAYGLCGMHYFRKRTRGEVGAAESERPGGSRIVTKPGYVIVHRPDHPFARNGYVLEHRLVMEDMLGRLLLDGENVHHKNGIRGDNRPENLELWSTAQPAGQRVEDKVAWCIEFLRLYRPEVLK